MSVTQVGKKDTKKQAKLDQQNHEKGLAKSMPFDAIVANIAEAKKARDTVQQDIVGLVCLREEQEARISKLNRVMLLKKRAAGA